MPEFVEQPRLLVHQAITHLLLVEKTGNLQNCNDFRVFAPLATSRLFFFNELRLLGSDNIRRKVVEVPRMLKGVTIHLIGKRVGIYGREIGCEGGTKGAGLAVLECNLIRNCLLCLLGSRIS